LIEKWWSAHRLEFTDEPRYVRGKPLTIVSLEGVMKKGKQRQRRAAAIELGMRRPGQPLFNTSAPGFRQQQLLFVKLY